MYVATMLLVSETMHVNLLVWYVRFVPQALMELAATTLNQSVPGFDGCRRRTLVA